MVDNTLESISLPSPGNPHRVKRICNSTITANNLPSLPKLHGKSTLAATKLCEQVYKSVIPDMFDLSSPKKQVMSTLLEYNSLQDPHLRSYFYHSPRRCKLKETGFITDDLDVICSLKKYNAYRQFLDGEFMKVYQHKYRESLQTEEQLFDHENDESHTEKDFDSTLNEREEKRKRFFEQQERKLRDKQRHLRRLRREEEKAKQFDVENKRLAKEMAEMKREALQEEKRMNKLKKEHEEAFKRKSMIDQAHIQEYLRLLQLHKMKQAERIEYTHKLEERWDKYDRHARLMHEEAESKKINEEKEKTRNLLKRKKLFKIMQKREEERKQRLLEENHQQVEILQKQAEKFETHWKNALKETVIECRHYMKKQQEHWNLQQRRLSQRSSSSMNAAGGRSNTSSHEQFKQATTPKRRQVFEIQEAFDHVQGTMPKAIATASKNSIVIENISKEDLTGQSGKNTSGLEVLSCEVVQSSSSKTKSVRFDVSRF